MCILQQIEIFFSKSFDLYLTEKEDEALTEHHSIFGVPALKIIDISDKINMETYCEVTKNGSLSELEAESA